MSDHLNSLRVEAIEQQLSKHKDLKRYFNYILQSRAYYKECALYPKPVIQFASYAVWSKDIDEIINANDDSPLPDIKE